MITICVTYFRSLTLANLRAALYSVRQQDFSHVREVIVVDNNTEDYPREIQAVVDAMLFPVSTRFISIKHGDTLKTHAWSTNVAVGEVRTPWVLFTRADYLLDFNLVKKFVQPNWNGFVTSNGCHLTQDVGVCEQTSWRTDGPRVFHGVEFDYTAIDAGVWMARKAAFDLVGGLDESLTAWGHAQTEFQYRLYKSGVEFLRIPEVLFYHPQHAGERDLALSHQQLRELNMDIHEMWARYDGAKPY